MPRRQRFALIAILLVALVFAFRERRNDGPDLDARSIVTQVRQLNQLATVRYTIQKVVGLTEQKQPVGAESILLVMQARVEAGIDLSSLREDQISRRPDGTVVVRLPDPRILNVAVDERETKVWDRQKTWWTPWVPYSKDLEQRARQAGLDAVQKSALEMGILKEAERNAETSIRGLLTVLGAKSVLVIPASAS
jgi:hypothetical protein